MGLAIFTYRAMDVDRSAAAGTVVADTPRQAREVLRDRGLTVQMLQARPTHGRAGRWRRWLVARHRSVVTVMARELATLIGVGVPLLEAMDTLLLQHEMAGDTRGRWRFPRRAGFKPVLLELRERVMAGEGLAQAMAWQPHVFDPMCIHLAQVGEDAGNLDQALDQLASFRERGERFKGQLLSALLYPAVVLLTGMGVTIFLMTMVVPNLLSTLLEAGRPLPWVTQVVKGISDGVVHHGWLLLLIGVGLAASWMAILSTDRGRHAFHTALLRLPWVGDLLRKRAMVRIASILSTLLGSGIVLVQALHVVEQSTGNLVIRDALRRGRQAIGAGHDIADAIARTQVFPPLVVQVFAVGQQSGKLETMLDRLAIDYDRQITTAADRLTSLLEPVLIVLLAVIVGFIAFATVLPILEAGNVL